MESIFKISDENDEWKIDGAFFQATAIFTNKYRDQATMAGSHNFEGDFKCAAEKRTDWFTSKWAEKNDLNFR